MSDETDIDGAAWAWERIEEMAERWRETPEWHDPPFHDGRIHVTTAELHAAAILVYRKSLGLEGGASPAPTETVGRLRPAKEIAHALCEDRRLCNEMAAGFGHNEVCCAGRDAIEADRASRSPTGTRAPDDET